MVLHTSLNISSQNNISNTTLQTIRTCTQVLNILNQSFSSILNNNTSHISSIRLSSSRTFLNTIKHISFSSNSGTKQTSNTFLTILSTRLTLQRNKLTIVLRNSVNHLPRQIRLSEQRIRIEINSNSVFRSTRSTIIIFTLIRIQISLFSNCFR